MRKYFGVGTVISEGFSVFFSNIGVILPIGMLLLLPQTIAQFLSEQGGEVVGPLLAMFVFLLSIPLGNLLQGFIVYGTWNRMQNKPFAAEKSLGYAFRRVLPLIGVAFIVGLLTILGGVLLIIPGIIVAVMFWVAVPAMMAENVGVGKAMERSRELTRGSRWAVFGVFVVSAIVVFLINMVVATPVVAIMSSMGQSTGATIITHLINLVLGAFSAGINACFVTVGYYALRQDVDGVQLEDLGAVFD